MSITLAQAIRNAIAAEHAAEKFYLRLAGATSDEKARQILTGIGKPKSRLALSPSRGHPDRRYARGGVWVPDRTASSWADMAAPKKIATAEKKVQI